MTRTRTHVHIAVVLVLISAIIGTVEGSWLQRFFASSMAGGSEPESESSGSKPSRHGVEHSQHAYSRDPNPQFEILENTVAEAAEPVSTVGEASDFRYEPNHNSNLKTVVGDLVTVSESILEKASRPSGLHWTVESKSATFIVLSIVGDAHVVSAGHQMVLALDDSVRLVETSIQGHVDVSATLSTPKPGHYDITAMLIDPRLRHVLASTGTGTLIVEGYSTKLPTSAKSTSSSTHDRGSESGVSSDRDHGADPLEHGNLHHDGDSAGTKESSKQSAGNQQQQTNAVKSESVKITEDINDPTDTMNSKGQILPSDDQRKVVHLSRRTRRNDLNVVTPDTESVLTTPFNHENHDSIQRCLEVSGKKLASLQLQAVTAPRSKCDGRPDVARDFGRTETCDDISGLCMTLFDQAACTTSVKELLHWVNITYAVPVTLSLEPYDSVMIVSFTSWRQRLVLRHNIEDIIEDGGGHLTMEAQNGDNIGLCIATSDGRVRYNVATTL